MQPHNLKGLGKCLPLMLLNGGLSFKCENTYYDRGIFLPKTVKNALKQVFLYYYFYYREVECGT